MSKRKLLIGFCIIMILLATVMFITATGFDKKTIDSSTMPGSQFFPMLTLGLIVCFSLGLMIKSLLQKDEDIEESLRFLIITKAEILRVIIIAAAMFIAYFLWDLLGFLPVAAFLIIVIGVTLRVKSVWGYVLLAAIATALFFTLNSLGVPLN